MRSIRLSAIKTVSCNAGESVTVQCGKNDVQKKLGYISLLTITSLKDYALTAANSLIVPAQPHFLSAKGLDLLIGSVSKVKRYINPKLQIDGILLTMVDRRTNLANEVIDLNGAVVHQPHGIFAVGLFERVIKVDNLIGGGRSTVCGNTDLTAAGCVENTSGFA